MPFAIGLVAVFGFLALAGRKPAAQQPVAGRREDERLHRALLLAVRARDQVAQLFGIPSPPIFAHDRVPNAAATPCCVHMNLAWLADQLDAFCADAACQWGIVIGVVAHEIGHVLDAYAFDTSDFWGRELRADRFAGRTLALLGVSPADFAAMLEILSAYPTPTHPPAALRVDALCDGYSEITGVCFVQAA